MRAFSFLVVLSMTLSCAAASNTLRGLQAAPAAPAGSAPKAAPAAPVTPAAPKAATPAAPAANATANAPVEIGVRAGTKDSFAGLEDMMRVSVNTLRVKDGQKPLESDLGLSQAALSLAEELAKKDAKDGGKLSAEDEATLLDRAKKAGFKGTTVKASSFSYDAKKEGLDAKNAESHTLAAMSAWSKNANATTVVDDGSMKMVGSAGVIAVSGEAYIVELVGA